MALGNWVNIQDGVYNTDWEIVGFDMESNRVASDGSTYDNGYGICMMPKVPLPGTNSIRWNNSDTLYGGYKASNIHNALNTTVANNLKTILGDHLINRNVLLSSDTGSEGTGRSNNYEWTTAYATLLSLGQITGNFAKHSNKYDDGEANYRLPLLTYTTFSRHASLRNIAGYDGGCRVWKWNQNGELITLYVSGGTTVTPLIYVG